MSPTLAHPVQVLREQTSALEAAIAACLDDPGHKAVHKLRTQTRRVEASLGLLARMPALPTHDKEASKLGSSLKKLRRAAGNVRDLDVQRERLGELAEPHGEAKNNPPATNARTPGKSQPGSTPKAEEAKAAATKLREAAEELHKHMTHGREEAFNALHHLLKHRESKTKKAIKALLGVFESAGDVTLPAPALLGDAEAVLTGSGLLGQVPSRLGERDLHTLRKAAKAARYVAESLPGNPALAAAARRFEALQEAGGQWHDALEIARAARRHFGKAHTLTAFFRSERDFKLKAFRQALSAQTRQGKRPQPAKATRHAMAAA